MSAEDGDKAYMHLYCSDRTPEGEDDLIAALEYLVVYAVSSLS